VVLYLCIVAIFLIADTTIKTGEIKMAGNSLPTVYGQSLPWSPQIAAIADKTQGQGTPYSNEYLASQNYPDYSSSGAAAPAYDPVAAAQAAQQQAARNSFNSGKTNIYDSASSAATGFVGSQRNNILDFIEGLTSSQQGIDRGRVKAQLGKDRASQGIMGMVGRGIKSGGTMLANRNAGDSSAAGAIAKAYGDLGNRQQSDVNNQFGMENEDFNVAQGQLGQQRASGLRRFATDSSNTVNSIVDQARQSFAALNDQAAGAGIEDRIAIEQEKEAIRQSTLAQIAELDQLASGANNVQAMGGDAVRSEAGRLNKLGQGEGSQYNFTSQAPAQMQNGVQLGQLPIYSNRRRQG